METLKSNWKTILIVILAVLIGVILARSCHKQPATTTGISIDSLKTANVITEKRYNQLSDSVSRVILEKDKQLLERTKTLNSITAKYRVLINRTPDKDTIVTYREVYIGKECLEKLPIIQGQLDICTSQIEDYQAGMNIKLRQIKSLQGQFDRSMAISNDQEKAIKKLKRKNKWLKVGITGTSILVLTGAIVVLAQ